MKLFRVGDEKLPPDERYTACAAHQHCDALKGKWGKSLIPVTKDNGKPNKTVITADSLHFFPLKTPK